MGHMFSFSGVFPLLEVFVYPKCHLIHDRSSYVIGNIALWFPFGVSLVAGVLNLLPAGCMQRMFCAAGIHVLNIISLFIIKNSYRLFWIINFKRVMQNRSIHWTFSETMIIIENFKIFFTFVHITSLFSTILRWLVHNSDHYRPLHVRILECCS